MKTLRRIWFALLSLFLFGSSLAKAGPALSSDGSLAADFQSPPEAARPWVYWFIMDGNLSREGITADFEAMRRAGIGGMVMMEVDAGVPRGPVKFMSAEWQELFAHAAKEAERLGLQITLNAGPGWTGSGGPWVKPEQSMQHLVASAFEAEGPGPLSQPLPRPQRRPAFFGDGNLPPELEKAKDDFYRDVAVLAFPTPEGAQRIREIDEKALYLRAPYSSQPGVKPYFPTASTYANLPSGETVNPQRILDLTDRLGPDGHLKWEVPTGRWTILRFGRTSTGANTRPAPAPGLGLESDKFDPVALEAHFESFVIPLLKSVGSRSRTNAGWTSLHIDSWEMGSQNWTANFREQFRRHRGYDPLTYLPVLTGRVVGSLEISERFLWDLRQTAQELVIEHHARKLKALGREHGLGLSIEPYDMNPCADMSLGGVADVPMCEFWLYGFDTAFTVIEAASIAHTLGRPIVAAEAFTSSDAERWQAHPASMKALGDWAFCAGVNRIVFHRYQHQPFLDRWPGMTMGPYGVHWERTQTWWDLVPAYHQYLSRCQQMLRRGLSVADVCFLVMEGAPHVFRPPPSATRGSPPDRLGFNFDGCAPETLLDRISVRNGQLVTPEGLAYRVLVLPESKTMTPRLLSKIKGLVQAGATVIGPRPEKSPSLSGYPACDAEVQLLADQVWGNCDGQQIRERRFGRGRVVWPSVRPPAAAEAKDPLEQAQWIWHAEGHPAQAAPVAKRWFRRVVEVNDISHLESATLHLTADNTFEARLNGAPLGNGDNFHNTYSFDVISQLKSGANLLVIQAANEGDAPNPAGLIGSLRLRFAGGGTVEFPTDDRWQSSATEAEPAAVTPGSTGPWRPALSLGTFGMEPWKRRANQALVPDQYGDFREVVRVLEKMGLPPDFEADAPLRYIHRREAGTDLYFVANPEDRPVTANCTFRIQGKLPELWDPVSGQTRVLPDFAVLKGRTSVPIRFAPHQSFFVVFRKRGAPSRKRETQVANFGTLEKMTELQGPWEVSFDPRWGGPAAVTFSTLEDWSRRPEPGIRFYSGRAAYRKTFDVSSLSSSSSRVFLDLGLVKNLARVRLNGHDLGVLWCAPWRLDVTSLLKPSGNQLEIEVANLWVNRLIGDTLLPPDQRLTWTTWNPFKKDMPLLQSGLLGPVTLQIESMTYEGALR
jgi:hypothetical protein